ncbi:MAG: hypothetical protein R3325_05200, partial [Thermoanaerobaculia bacterium]|nr:hypothetical protein [Thermoanaerobaculia bacterium]
AVAAVLAVGIAAWPALLARRSRRWRTAAATGVALAALAYPLFAATAVTVRRNRPSTGELAVQWIRAHVPEGAAFLREDYTPALRRELYPQVHRRFAARMSLAEIRDPAWDYLLLSHSAYGRFLDPALWSQPHHQEFARRYEAMFGFDLVREFTPGWFRAGPLLRLYRLDPEEIDYRRKRLFAADRADWVSDPQIREAPRPRRLRYTRRWQYALFKEYFDAGAYRARIEYRPREAEGYLHVVSREGREVGTFPMGPEVRLDLPEPGKYFFKVFLAPPTELFGLLVEPAE